MFGAFTDGKSTLLSALTKKLDIRIAPEPTTDSIQVYPYGDYVIVDTPGLFSDDMLHDERTKKYISEANVLLYTVDPVNPLKESHHATIRWLLQDLQKIDSTIFIVNKMDEIADLDDEKDFELHASIKKEVVRDTLGRILSHDVSPRIVCTAGNPFDQGLEHWFANEEEYMQLSRIPLLVEELNAFIRESRSGLMIKAGISVIRDAVLQLEFQLKAMNEKLSDKLEVIRNQEREVSDSVETLQRDISRKHQQIKEEILTIRQDLLVYMEGAADRKQFGSRVQERLGNNGYILQERINLVIQKYTEQLLDEQDQLIREVETSVEYHNQLQSQLLEYSRKMGMNLVSKLGTQSTRAIADSILKLRDMTKLNIKFKPWGAMKWASRISKFAAWMPVIVDVVSMVMKAVEEQKLQSAKQQMKEQLEELFKDFFESFTIEDYTAAYFPAVKGTIDMLKEIRKSTEEFTQLKATLGDIASRLREDIELLV
ncbi:GTP-binding protein EngB required for normal cell division [Cohnella thailandensis]|uniref:50S ribosome-binding GTPase n=2 Tax=Cohnella thailandensis TaxID=557557 RepID=A0A841SSE4_9BACL|nr:LeoA/HP0731 family dynamin-like GTPase [Cohnella thailandensis]MBB6633506.1 50S ribosome-binding GTPase [Cohnella thailandensis]MBP1974523.1 GTP-binding protein EngB required for normal cell division [Cohnella thailandensis]